MSLDTWLITILSLGYLLLLFFVAYWGQHNGPKWTASPWVYSLALGVSCTSWAFYGIIGQTSITGEPLAPIYIGTIASVILCWPLLLKMMRVSKQQNLTSIADFIACRYEKAPSIAMLVSIIALVGTVPYIALQLRAISQSFDLVTGSYQSGINTTFIVTLVMIVFSILFGARHIITNKQNKGLLLAIAFSSVIKLLAISVIGVFVFYSVFNSDLSAIAAAKDELISYQSNHWSTLSQIVLGALTIFVTPQLFHMIAIENQRADVLAKARWQYPLFLIAINLFVLPIALAGDLTFPGGSVNADTYILTLPLYHQQSLISILVFIGGLAAATSMVIIAAIVLSTMITTEVVTPALLKLQPQINDKQVPFSKQLLHVRRIIIAAILLLGFVFERVISQQSHLASLGLLSFVLLAQFAPAVIAALYWQKATSRGALWGLTIGGVVWAYTLLLPTLLPQSDIVLYGLFELQLLKPTELFGIDQSDMVSHGTFLSLLLNTLSLFLVSISERRSVGETLQAQQFVTKYQNNSRYQLTIADINSLLKRFVNLDAVEQFKKLTKQQQEHEQASAEQITFCQKQLASVLGSASTRLVIKAITNNTANSSMSLEQVAHIVDEANQLFEFNRELLQAGVENIEQGISVVDADMRLVAWNQRYIELLQYPNNLVIAGMPVETLIRFNAQRGLIQGDDLEQLVAVRLNHMKAGHRHASQRVLDNGLVLEIRGQAMPGGGFVSTFTDITKHIEAEKALQKANENLELRVQQRTAELNKAKAQAEAANNSKTRFLAAASHDLMQPFNALSLFTAMLKQQTKDSESAELATNIENSLNVVEALLSDLVEISKLDASSQSVNLEPIAISELLDPLAAEFSAIAKQQQVEFTYIKSSKWIITDKRLLRRVIQNLLSNAISYVNQADKKAKVLLGVRENNGNVSIQVIDNGPGIKPQFQQQIFTEFERLQTPQNQSGLGLGLAISQRIAVLLKSQVGLQSAYGSGSKFFINQPKSTKQLTVNKEPLKEDNNQSPFTNLTVLIIDNDKLMLKALEQQITNWGCDVIASSGNPKVLHQQVTHIRAPELIIADYHLDDGMNGVDLVQGLKAKFNWSTPCIVCSADPSESIRQHCNDAQYRFINKPVKALALKRLIKQLI